MEAQPISITLQDMSAGYPVSPQRVPLAVLRSFARDVDDLLRGESAEIDTSKLDVKVFDGSLGVLTEPIANPGLLQDLKSLGYSELLEGVDAKRREVIERWQKAAKGVRNAVIRISAPFLQNDVVISSKTDFHADDADQWVTVERYVQGEVVEIGGQRNVNAHLRLPDGTLLAVESERAVFRDDKVNRLYKIAMVRITADYNVVTRKYRGAKLLAFEEHHNEVDEAQSS